MPRTARRVGCAAFLAVSTCLICAGVWLLGFASFGLPQAAVRLGPAAPGLPSLQQNALAFYLLLRASALDAAAGDPAAAIEIEVREGEPADVAIERLVVAGVVDDAFLLKSYMRYRGLDVGVEAGKHSFNGAMTLREIAQQLQSAQPVAESFTVLPGWRSEQIAESLDALGASYDPEGFLALIREPSQDFLRLLSLPPKSSLEGFLFPDTYFLDPEAGPAVLIAKMIQNFNAQMTDELRMAYQSQGLSLTEAVILASIVEREAVIAEEQAIIASVFLNRLALGMKLDADPTVQYALGGPEDGWWKKELTTADLQVDSPFNTYQVTGLPPFPIANPGLGALRSVAIPVESEFLYFRARCDGSGRHLFAVTFEEHLLNACP